MNMTTFREWLRECGCTFEERRPEHGGHPMVVARRGARRAELPAAGGRDDLDPAAVARAVEALSLDPADLPGPRSRV